MENIVITYDLRVTVTRPYEEGCDSLETRLELEKALMQALRRIEGDCDCECMGQTIGPE